MADPWLEWAAGVLSGVDAPMSAVNEDTLWAWSGAESGLDRMRWNNPLNTTEELLAGQDVDPDMNRVGVEAYPTVQDGVIATVATLKNGLYPMILDHLRRSIPRGEWQDACENLTTWGTGCAWLNEQFGSPTGSIGVEEMNSTDVKGVILAAVHGTGQGLLVTQAQVDSWAAEYPAKALDVIIAEVVNTAAALANKPPKPGPQGQKGDPGTPGTVPAHDHVIPANTTEPYTP